MKYSEAQRVNSTVREGAQGSSRVRRDRQIEPSWEVWSQEHRRVRRTQGRQRHRSGWRSPPEKQIGVREKIGNSDKSEV